MNAVEKNNEHLLKIHQDNSQIHEHCGKMNEDRVKFSQKHQKNVNNMAKSMKTLKATGHNVHERF